jgi:peptidoglycan/xylan/chitin deacetylase (PgdA/CDA1 family)
VHAILRRGAAGLAALAVGVLTLMVCVAVLAWGDSGLASQPSSSSALQQADPLRVPPGMAVGRHRQVVVTHHWVIPVGRRFISVPILMYHYIRKPPSILSDKLGFDLSVSPADFSLQMDWLAAHGYNPVTLNDLRAYFSGRHALPAKPVVITLDDGYADLYQTAFPILQAHNFKAVAYIVSGFVGHPRYVTAPQVLELAHYGIEIASHTVNHADLARTSPPMVTWELSSSKKWLQDLLGHAVLDFAYPSGRFSSQVIAAVQMTGYQSAATTMPGTYHSEADRFTWTRVRVHGGESLLVFTQNLGPVEKAVEITKIDVIPAAG